MKNVHYNRMCKEPGDKGGSVQGSPRGLAELVTLPTSLLPC